MRTFCFFGTAKSAFFVSKMICTEYVLKVGYAHDYPFELLSFFLVHTEALFDVVHSPRRRWCTKLIYCSDDCIIYECEMTRGALFTFCLHVHVRIWSRRQSPYNGIPRIFSDEAISGLPSLLELPKTLGSIDCLSIYNVTTKTVK